MKPLESDLRVAISNIKPNTETTISKVQVSFPLKYVSNKTARFFFLNVYVFIYDI